jgi:hypothetical protein
VAPFTDPISGLKFPNFFSPLNPLIQPSLIFPVPFEFSPNLPRVSMIRPLTDKFAGAMAAVKGLTASGLFIGQSPQFFYHVEAMAAAADAAQRGVLEVRAIAWKPSGEGSCTLVAGGRC